jgi:hypothetical protein
LGPNVAYFNGIEVKIKNTKKTANPPIYEISEPFFFKYCGGKGSGSNGWNAIKIKETAAL